MMDTIAQPQSIRWSSGWVTISSERCAARRLCTPVQPQPILQGPCLREVPMAPRKDVRRIGLLVPSSSSVQEWDIGRALPDDVTLHVARMRLSNVDAESTLRVVQEIETESQKLADVDVDVVIFPATAPSSRNGIGYDQELIKRISAASGKPATTASTALLEAFHALSVKQ